MRNLPKQVKGYDYKEHPEMEAAGNENLTKIYAAVWIIETYYQAVYNWLKQGDSRNQYLCQKLGLGLTELLKGFKQVNIRMAKQGSDKEGLTKAEEFEDDMLCITQLLERAIGLPEAHREEILEYIDSTYFVKETKDGSD